MDKIQQFISVQQTDSIPYYGKINSHLIKHLKAGLLGFTAILVIIFFMNLISYIIGSSGKIGVDSLDFQLAGVGFILQVASTSLKNFIR
jgi:hypothetical protein